MSKTYIHHQGFVYGPVDSIVRRPSMWPNMDAYFEKITSLTKYKWTGPELPDWGEVVEGRDFEIEEQLREGIVWRTRTVAVPVLKQDIYSKLEALKKENEFLKEKINQLNKIINHEMGKSK